MSAIHEWHRPTDGLNLPDGVLIMTPYAGGNIECQIVGNTLALLGQPVSRQASVLVRFVEPADHQAASRAVEWLHRQGWRRAVLSGPAVHEFDYGGEA